MPSDEENSNADSISSMDEVERTYDGKEIIAGMLAGKEMQTLNKRMNKSYWKFLVSNKNVELKKELSDWWDDHQDLFEEGGVYADVSYVADIIYAKEHKLICTKCWADDTQSVKNTLVAPGSNASGDKPQYNNSNIQKHFDRKHPGWASAAEAKVMLKKKASNVADLLGCKVLPKCPKTLREANPVQLKSEFNSLLTVFINDMGLPDSACESPILREFIGYLLNNSFNLLPLHDAGDLNMGRRQFCDVRENQFLSFFVTLEEHIQRLNDHWKEVFGKEVKYLHCSIDHWDGYKEFLGISLHFMTFKDWTNKSLDMKVIRVPVGLVKVTSHTAKGAASDVL